MNIEILNYGDEVSFFSSDYIAITRANGEYEIIPIVKKNESIILDIENAIKLGYKDTGICVEEYEDITVIDF